MNAITSVLHRLKALGLTQVEINRRTGIPQPRLSRWAAGSVPPGAEDALKLKGLLDGIEAGAPPADQVRAQELVNETPAN